MLVIALWWISTLKASLNYKDLVVDVSKTFDDCFDIVGDVDDYLRDVEALGNIRRRPQDGGHALQLWACVSMLKAMDQYRDKHSRFAVAQGLLHWKEREFLNQYLKPVSKKVGKFPIYVASMDGDGSIDFHEKCNGKGPTVVIVKTTTGKVFGGYTSVSWSSAGIWKRAPTSFLFQLRPRLSHFALRNRDDRFATLQHPDYGPTFGEGNDLMILGGALSHNRSKAKGKTYRANGHTLNDGTQYFQVKDYAVFQAINL